MRWVLQEVVVGGFDCCSYRSFGGSPLRVSLIHFMEKRILIILLSFFVAIPKVIQKKVDESQLHVDSINGSVDGVAGLDPRVDGKCQVIRVGAGDPDAVDMQLRLVDLLLDDLWDSDKEAEQNY